MKVILYMAITTNGMIAGPKDDTSFVSKEDWKGFQDVVRKYGNLVVGRRTYEIMQNEPIPPCQYVVMTSRKRKDTKDAHFTNQRPKSIIQWLKKKGFNIVLVAGGGKLNQTFMEAGVIDEIHLDIEPKILGKGTPLFQEGKFDANLELVSVKNISKNTIHLHYTVKK
jgi:dihydrofolate reductase